MIDVLLFLSGVFLGAIFGYLLGGGFKGAKISDLESELYYTNQSLKAIEQSFIAATEALHEKQNKWLPPDSSQQTGCINK